MPSADYTQLRCFAGAKNVRLGRRASIAFATATTHKTTPLDGSAPIILSGIFVDARA